MADAAKKASKKTRSHAKGVFHRYLNTFHAQQRDGAEEDAIVIIMADLERAYTEVEEKHKALMEHYDSDEDEEDKKGDTDQVKVLNEDMDTMYLELCKARHDVAVIKKKVKMQEETKKEKGKSKEEESKKLKVKPLQAPSFSGNVREYPSFKKDYEAHMVPHYGKDTFALKNCLSGDALIAVQPVDDSYDEMIQRLDFKFGRPETLVDAILNELKSLRKVEDSNNREFVKMVDIVERCYLDLKKVNLQSELNTASMLAQFEKKLPAVRMHEWALKKQKLLSGKAASSTIPFEIFLEYLQEQRRAMEYADENVRIVSSSSASTTKGIVNTASHSTCEDGKLNEIQCQLDQLVKGLAHVAEIVATKPEDRQSPKLGRKNKCYLHNTDSHNITTCTAFARLSQNDRHKLVLENRACFCCLQCGHQASNCSTKTPCGTVHPTTNVVCGVLHHPLLHRERTGAVHVAINRHKNKQVLLMLVKVVSKGVVLNCLFDPCATMSLITTNAIQKLRVNGEDIVLSVTKAGNVTDTEQSKEYEIPVTMENGRKAEIVVCEMKEITSEMEKVDTKLIHALFPYIPSEALSRPFGKVDILIGGDCNELLPVKVDSFEGMDLMKGPLGYCVRGSHESIKIKASSTVNNVMAGQILHVARLHKPKEDPIKTALDQFFTVEALGVQCSPKCGGCRCGQCALGTKNFTIKEEKELGMVEEALSYNADDEVFTASYPNVKSYHDLPNNVHQVKKFCERQERRIESKGEKHAESYEKEFQDMISRKVIRKMNPDDWQYKGPVHYLPHFEVMNENSKSTKLRIVFNASSSFRGHRLNDYWVKGPSMVNDMLGVLLTFREDTVAAVGDIKKMFNAVLLAYPDQHLHRVLWRNLDKEKEFDHYMLQTVTFGDKPSGTIAIVALRKTAALSEQEYPEEAKIIKEQSFVDDLCFCQPDQQASREKRRNIEKVLKKAKFFIKRWVVSGIGIEEVPDSESRAERKNNPNMIGGKSQRGDDEGGYGEEGRIQNEGDDRGWKVLQVDDEKVLGMYWDPVSDCFKFVFLISLGGMELHTPEDCYELILKVICRRMILGQIAKVFDPYGLLVPFLLMGKLLMREMCLEDGTSLGWDAPLNSDMLKQWIEFFRMLLEVQELRFRRCVKPAGAVGDPILVVFSDGSDLAYGCCAYIRWEDVEGSYVGSTLLASKNRIAPKKKLTPPRLELCGAVLAVRLRKSIVESMGYKFKRIIHVTDSTIVRAQIQKESQGFNTFAGPRIGEVQTKSDPSEWLWCESGDNPADMTTRVTFPSELGPTSRWQIGPDYFKIAVELWPLYRDAPDDKELPDRRSVIMTADSQVESRNVIQVTNFSKYELLLQVTAIVMLMCRFRTFKISPEVNAEGMALAEEYWIRKMQIQFHPDWKKRFQRLGPLMMEGMIVVGKRMSQWLKQTWNQDYFILLPDDAEFTKLYVRKVHEEDHSRDVDVTVAKVRRRFWVPRLKKLVKSIRDKCMLCRRKDKELETQEMGDLPLDRFLPAPPFYNSSLDFLGPYWIKDTVKRRVKRKVFGVLYSSSTEHSVYLDVAEGYDTDSYFMVQRRFVSIRGYPKKMRSDLGSQLVCADKEMQELLRQLDWRRIGKSGVEWGMEWEFTKSADAPWENGLSEALVKLVKRNLSRIVGDHVLTFSELQTVFFEIANLLNERPIGIHPSDPEEGTYLCPNDLLLGRASVRVPPGTMDTSRDPKKRVVLVQQIADAFWKKWQRDYFHTLIVRQKWHVAKRSVQVNDIVLVQDSNTYRGNWRLAEVTEAVPGKDNKVRDVLLRYKAQRLRKGYQGQPDINLKRSVHKLVVILPAEERKNAGQSSV